MIDRKQAAPAGNTAVTRTPVGAPPKTKRHFADLRVVLAEGISLPTAEAMAAEIAKQIDGWHGVSRASVVQVAHVDARPRGIDPVE